MTVTTATPKTPHPLHAEIENGLIARTSLGYEGHNILSFMISITFDGSGQGYGGFGLDDLPKKLPDGSFANEREPSPALGVLVRGMLRTFEVDAWEKLKGQHCRVQRDKPYGRIIALGHIIKNQWFNFEEEVEPYITTSRWWVRSPVVPPAPKEMT